MIKVNMEQVLFFSRRLAFLMISVVGGLSSFTVNMFDMIPWDNDSLDSQYMHNAAREPFTKLFSSVHTY